MSDFYPYGSNSSIDINRNSKGEYTWGIKLYFLGHDMRIIKQVITNIIKAKSILEAQLGQKVIPTEEMSEYEKELTEAAKKCAQQKEA